MPPSIFGWSLLSGLAVWTVVEGGRWWSYFLTCSATDWPAGWTAVSVTLLTCPAFCFLLTAARREPPLAAESRPARPAAAQKPNGECLEDTPDETTHTVAKVVAQKKSVTLRFTLQFPPMSWSMQPGAFSCCFNWNKTCWPSGVLTLPLFGFQYFCK